jgi:hypothetical protein
VHITTDGFDLLWKKGDRVNCYAFNGREYDKPDRGVPDFLAEAGLTLVKVGDKTGSIQVADQFFPIFLLDQSGPAIAEAISDVSQLDNINAATKLVEKDRRSVMETRKVREKDASDLASKLSKYDTLDEKLVLVKEAEKGLLAVNAQYARAQALEKFLRALEDLKKDLTSLDVASKIEVPESSGLPKAVVTAVSLHGFLGEISRRGREVKLLGDTEKSLRDFPDDSPLSGQVEKLGNVREWMARLRKIKGSFASSESADAAIIPDSEGMATSVAKLRELSSFTARNNSLSKASSDVQASLEKLEAEGQSITLALAPLKKALSEIEVCPSCSRPMKGPHEHAETFFSFSD